MNAQLELDLAPDAPAAPPPAPQRRLRALFAALLHWTPVWVPLVFLAQLIVLGFLPAESEKERLDRAEAEVRARADTLTNEERELAAQARMLSDGVFQERVRKSLLDPNSAPLTLERARSGSGP